MFDGLRTLKPAVTRTALTGALALSVIAVPGSTAHAATAAVPEPALIIAGSVLHPKPVRYVLPVRSYRLTGEFGDTSSLWHTVHTGLDFAAPSGTPIHSIAAGRAVSSEYDGRYGNKTVIRLADGTELWFCHQSSSLVQAGDRVRAGQLIGYVGSTGNVTGPHLHLEVRPTADNPVDPDHWLSRHGVTA